MTWMAVAIGGSAVVGGIASSSAAGSASRAQDRAAQSAANAQLEATRMQTEASLTGQRENIAFQREAMGNQRQDLLDAEQRAKEYGQPWYDTGKNALADYSNLFSGARAEAQPGTMSFVNPAKNISFGDYMRSPEYQFAMEEGTRAVERGAAAKGRLYSPSTAKELTRYGQGVASQQFGNYYNRAENAFNNYANRLAALAGVGQTQANTSGQNAYNTGNSLAQASQGTAGRIGDAITAGANARATGYANAGNAQAQLYSNLGASQAGNYLAQGNAITGGINNALNAYGQYNAYRNNPYAYKPEASQGYGSSDSYSTAPTWG